jgi:hypothetical protein
MSMPEMQQESAVIEPVQEGGRWRYERPTNEEVAKWFGTVPLDEGMGHEDYVAGVVTIKATEKVKKPKADGRGTVEDYESTWTPYVRVDTRVTYFRKLAALTDQVAVIRPVMVPRIEQAAYYNMNMADGFWWMIMGEQDRAQRFLCATWRVALYDAKDWLKTENALARLELAPTREGIGTKSVSGSPDADGVAKAETGAIGRALGVAGILVVGSGIATAEDMAELGRASEGSPVALPPAGAPEESAEALQGRLIRLEAELRPYTDAWREFSAWWAERSKVSGWRSVGDAPIEARRGVATKIEAMLLEQETSFSSTAASGDSNPAESQIDETSAPSTT